MGTSSLCASEQRSALEQLQKPSEPPHQRPVEDGCILPLHAASSWTGRHAAVWATLNLRSLLLVENSSPSTGVVERYCAERCTQGSPAPLPVQRQRGGWGADKARLEFLSFDGMGGGVCRHVTKHTACMISYP